MSLLHIQGVYIYYFTPLGIDLSKTCRTDAHTEVYDILTNR